MIYFTDEQLNDILRLYKEDKTLKEISELYNVSRPTISKILSQKYSPYTGKRELNKIMKTKQKSVLNVNRNCL